MKGKAHEHTLSAFWLAYYVSCSLALSGKSRVPAHTSEIGTPSGVMPSLPLLMNPYAKAYRFKGPTEAHSTTRPAAKRPKDSPSPIQSPLACDDSSHEFKDPSKKSGAGKAKRSKTQNKKEGDNEELDKSDNNDEDDDKGSQDMQVDNDTSSRNQKGSASMISMMTRSKQTPEKKALIDSGATKNTVKNTQYIERYMSVNSDKVVTVKTASGHKLKVTHTGHVPGMGDVLVCPAISDNLLSTLQLLKNKNGVEMVAGASLHHSGSKLA
jgi:hypothetical protein